MGALRSGVGGLAATLRLGHVRARALAVADSRTLVRALFLSSAVRTGLLDQLGRGASLAQLVERTGCTRPDRLEAWLAVGHELGELGLQDGRHTVRGQRARAIAAGDPVLSAHYRSILDYQAGPYEELESLLHAGPRDGRDDLEHYADDIAQVSLAAAPFASAFVQRVVRERRPAEILDVGCGTAVYSRVALDVDPAVLVTGIDLSEEVIDEARAAMERAGLGSRVTLTAGDVRPWAQGTDRRFDLVMLHNNIYYFSPSERADLYRSLGTLLTERGELVLTSMTTPGSIAAAHLNLMLVCQAGVAALPDRATVVDDLVAAGFAVTENTGLVPTEPFVGLRAVRRRA